MNKNYLLPVLVTAALLCGCNKQTKINSAKIELLSQNIIRFELNQAKQMAAIQTELDALGPMLDKMNDAYFEKSHDQAIFLHTNTLYLLLMVDKKIEAQLQAADTERAAQNALNYGYYTNQMAATYQVQDALTTQEGRMTDKLNTETRRVGVALHEELLKQADRLAPDAAEIARRTALAADVAEVKADLERIKAQLGTLVKPR